MSTRKGEGEAERIGLTQVEMMVLHEQSQTVGDVLEELLAGALHDALGDDEDLVDDLGLLVLAQADEEHAEVGAAQVERQYVVALLARRQLTHVRG